MAKNITSKLSLRDGLHVEGKVTVNGDANIGKTTSDKIGFFGVTAVDQPATVADPTDEATNVIAIVAIIDRLQELGLIA